MAQNINTVAVTGNLTKDPELKTTKGGTSVCKMRVAVNGRTKRDDEWVDDPNYFDVTVWGKQGENCAEYLKKGRPVAVAGRLNWHEWETEDGGKRQAVDIIAESVQFLGGRDGGGSSGEDAQRQKEEDHFAGAAAASDVPDSGGGDVPDSGKDDIPF